MKKAGLLVVSVATLMWVAWTQTVWRGHTSAPAARATTAPAAPRPAPRVQVEHHLVTVPLPAASASPATPSAATGRRTSTRTIRTLRPERYGMFAKTRRTFFGDGRYRPEPFPRPR